LGLSLNEVWGDVVMLLVLGIIYTLLGVGVGFLRNSVALRSLFRKRSA
jgi:ABC-2 type transport system permease protein